MRQHRSGPQLRHDLKWGLTYSGGLTTFFAALAVAGRLMLGPSVASGLSLTTLLMDYAVLGVVGGVLAGFGRPLTSSMPGVAFLGAVWGVFLGLLIRVTAVGGRPWGYFDVLMTVIYVMAGALFGISLRRGVLRGEARHRDASRQP
jgi:hypothetical protein